MLAGQVAALEEEGLALTDSVTGEDSESKVEAVGGLKMHLAQVMSHYQRDKRQCFVCVGHQAISPVAAPTARHLGNGIETKRTPKGWGRVALPPQGQRVPDRR